MPWKSGRQSIYQHICEHISESSPGLIEGGDLLPDEDVNQRQDSIRWASGAMDGVLNHHFGDGTESSNINDIYEALQTVLADPKEKRIDAFYDLVLQHNTLDYIDQLIKKIYEKSNEFDAEKLYKFARFVVTEAPDREPVKFGLAILGIFQLESEIDLFLTIGRHDEFTLFAATALSNLEQGAEQHLWALAKNVNGWGRIQTVERLSGTNDPDIKAWLLREGFRNSVMDEYLAYLAATTGDLVNALKSPHLDDALIEGAGDMILAMIEAEAAAGMDDYVDAAEAVSLYLSHVKRLKDDLKTFLVVNAITEYVQNEDVDWVECEENGWTLANRAEVEQLCDGMLKQPKWRTLALAGLESEEKHTFWQARSVAQALHIDTWEYTYKRQQVGRSDEWYFLMQTDDPERIDIVIELAETKLPVTDDELDENTNGEGMRFQSHDELSFILQGLGQYPGKGINLIIKGLNSSIARNRYSAVSLLEKWEQDNWSNEIVSALKHASLRESDIDLQSRIKALINEM